MASHLCEWTFSDGVECLETAVASIVHPWRRCWYCAEHYDGWMAYYRRAFHGYGNDEAGRVLKANR